MNHKSNCLRRTKQPDTRQKIWRRWSKTFGQQYSVAQYSDFLKCYLTRNDNIFCHFRARLHFDIFKIGNWVLHAARIKKLSLWHFGGSSCGRGSSDRRLTFNCTALILRDVIPGDVPVEGLVPLDYSGCVPNVMCNYSNDPTVATCKHSLNRTQHRCQNRNRKHGFYLKREEWTFLR